MTLKTDDEVLHDLAPSSVESFLYVLQSRNLFRNSYFSGMTFGMDKRFDEMDRHGFGEFVKKNFDEIDSSGFGRFVKKNFDEIDRAGFGSFVKRPMMNN